MPKKTILPRRVSLMRAGAGVERKSWNVTADMSLSPPEGLPAPAVNRAGLPILCVHSAPAFEHPSNTRNGL